MIDKKNELDLVEKLNNNLIETIHKKQEELKELNMRKKKNLLNGMQEIDSQIIYKKTENLKTIKAVHEMNEKIDILKNEINKMK